MADIAENSPARAEGENSGWVNNTDRERTSKYELPNGVVKGRVSNGSRRGQSKTDLSKDSTSNFQLERSTIYTAVLEGHVQEVIKILSQQKNRVDHTFGLKRQTLLHIAVKKGNTELVKILGENGCDPNKPDKKGRTPLHYAIKNTSVLETLLAFPKIDLLVQDKDGCLPLHLATKAGNKNSVTMMLSKGSKLKQLSFRNSQGYTALHIATKQLDVPLVKLLCEQNDAVYWNSEEDATTPLHLAAEMGSEELIRMLATKASVNLMDEEKNTALHLVSKNDCSGGAKYLIEQGADINIRNAKGETPLHTAVLFGAELVCHILLTSGGDIGVRYEKSLYDKRRKNEIRRILDQMSQNPDVDVLGLSLDRYGFIRMSGTESRQEEEDSYPDTVSRQKSEVGGNNRIWLKPEKTKKLNHQTRKWIKLLSKLNSQENTSTYSTVMVQDTNIKRKLRKYLYNGVPNSLRPGVWRVISGAGATHERHTTRYQKLLARESGRSDKIQIDLDVARTYRNHFLFHERFGLGQISLYNILRCYSIYDPAVGYCQGMSDITGLILMYMEEEEAFWLLATIMQDERFRLTERFQTSFRGLKKAFYVHDRLVETMLPKLYKSLSNCVTQPIQAIHYTIKWYLKCYLDMPSFELTLRIWDVLLYEGIDILYSFSLYLLKYHESTILKTTPDEYMTSLSTFAHSPKLDEKHIKAWFKDVRDHPIKSETIKKLKDEFEDKYPLQTNCL
ncbi:uncharacterized protein LOC126316906 [Schistocerca gregaria]|uniref:uncharacterized protein LOC126316906 n=1 Tax=Schistocerca gregaria TaxID=7010 RepID=UPI00211DE7DA|nr:uncharacterized protein LOC126316906 [Schistocerca gregaria]